MGLNEILHKEIHIPWLGKKSEKSWTLPLTVKETITHANQASAAIVSWKPNPMHLQDIGADMLKKIFAWDIINPNWDNDYRFILAQSMNWGQTLDINTFEQLKKTWWFATISCLNNSKIAIAWNETYSFDLPMKLCFAELKMRNRGDQLISMVNPERDDWIRIIRCDLPVEEVKKMFLSIYTPLNLN